MGSTCQRNLFFLTIVFLLLTPASPSVVTVQPKISLTSPNRGLVWGPEGAEITRGYSFVIECSISPVNPGGFFHLIFFSVSNITDTKSAVNYSASFNFPAAEYEHQGNYSCVYEVTGSEGKNTSRPSAPIRVIIKVHLWLVVSLVTSGVLLLLLLLLLVVCLVHRRRQQINQPGDPILNQMTIRNSYEDNDDEDDDDDEDDKRDYVNIELFNTKSEQIEEVGGTEEEDDDDCDYVNMETENNYIACADLLVTGQDKEEEEDDKESSDDENDYVNAPGQLTHLSH
ncbi:hypothetical protein EXN66_Car015292 [Channa argus]|uniref:Immunoglobulin-like beta-sandwich domain-containing protein n=1 Tax=Channa argus TaxID=215402 RepID=A0A6G1QAM8_CHAAH|nr:hypothetical protein EXN66_Car015292 [Channa argus]